MKTVELRTAYAYDCDDCGRENFCRSVVAEFSSQEHQDIRESIGEGGNQTGQWVLVPDTVTCTHCGSKFETVDFRDDQ